MKIFIGGVKMRYLEQFHRRFPTQEFAFAAEDDPPGKWMRRAAGCDNFIVLQHRTSHKHVDYLHARGVRPHFTDRMPMVYALIERMQHGALGNLDVRAVRSKDSPALPA